MTGDGLENYTKQELRDCVNERQGVIDIQSNILASYRTKITALRARVEELEEREEELLSFCAQWRRDNAQLEQENQRLKEGLERIARYSTCYTELEKLLRDMALTALEGKEE